MELQNKKRGLTLIETMLSMSLLSAGVLTGAHVIKEKIESDNAQRHASFALSILKLVDRRVEIDGYLANRWDSLPNPTSTAELIDFSKKAFISKNNLECGLSTGWEPLLEEASDIALIPCSFGEQMYKLYDFQLFRGQNNENMLQNVDVIMRLNPSTQMDEEGVLLQHKELLNFMKSSPPTLKRGVFDASFANFNDIVGEDSLTLTECRLLGNDCVIKASWKSDGYAESLKVDGSNNIVGDNISFAEDYRSSAMRCDMWEYDGDSSYSFSGDVECGIGLYSKTLRPVAATVDAVVSEVSVVDPIILKENCNVYEKDANGFLISTGVSPCGLFTGANGSQKVIQVVEEMQVGSGLSITDYTTTVVVDELIAKELNSSYMDIKDQLTLKNTGEAELNTLIVEAGAKSTFSQQVKMKTLEMLSNAEFKSSVTINNNSTSTPALDVKEDAELNGLLNTVNGTLTVDDPNANTFRLKQNSGIINGAACNYKEDGNTIYNGIEVLTCRETSTSGVFRWSAYQFGEIGLFESSCPSGWTPFANSDGRTLINSGWYIDKTGKKIKYNVGDKGGQAKVRLTLNELPAHSHGFRDAYWSEHWGDYGPRNQKGSSGGQDNDNNLYVRNITSASKGGNAAHENRMPYVVVKVCQYQKGNGLTESDSEPNLDPNNYWYPYPPEITDWLPSGPPYNCSGYSYENLPSGEYWLTYCDQDYEKYEKEREINYVTGQIRFTGIVNPFYKTERPSVVWERGPNIYDPWYNVGTHYNCSTTAVSISPYGSSQYKIILNCSIDKERWYQETIVQKDSNGNVLNSQNWGNKKKEQGTFKENFEHIVSEASLSKTCDAWYKVGATDWLPDPSTVNYGQTFTQTRDVSYNRACRYYTSLKGNTYLVKSTTEGKVEGQSRNEIGTRNYITHTGFDSWGSWSNTSGAYNCGTYNPDPSTVDQGKTFTQSRPCSQNQRRSRTEYYYWADGSRTYKGIDSENRTVTIYQTRSAVGTKPTTGTWVRTGTDFTTIWGCTGQYIGKTCSPIGAKTSIPVSNGQSSGVPICITAHYTCK